MFDLPLLIGFFLAIAVAATIRYLHKQETFHAKINAYKPYDVLLLKDGEAVNLLMWSSKHVIYQRSSKAIEYHKWGIIKVNVTYAKRSVVNECEANFTRLGIPFPIVIKKQNIEEDSIYTKYTGIEPREEADVNNLEFLDGLDDDQLGQLRIEMEEHGLYEDLAKLRDYIILRETKGIK